MPIGIFRYAVERQGGLFVGVMTKRQIEQLAHSLKSGTILYKNEHLWIIDKK